MTIFFGDKSFERYQKGLSLKEGVPSEGSMEWVKINKDKQTIESAKII